MSLRKVIIAAAVAAVCIGRRAAEGVRRLAADAIPRAARSGGSANVCSSGRFSNDFEQKLNYGASLAWMGGGDLRRSKFDFGYSPNFFGVSNSNPDFDLIGDGNVTTAMGNMVVGAPLGALRPYASGGVGLIAIEGRQSHRSSSARPHRMISAWTSAAA